MAAAESIDLGSLLRISFVSIIFLLNFFALTHLLFRRLYHHTICTHTTVYGLSLVLINAFVCTWIPYLFTTFFYQTAWPYISIDLHCDIQQNMPLLISTILLIIFCFQKIFETFSTKRSQKICLCLLFMWLLPQTCYLIFSHLTAADHQDFYFIDANHHRSSNVTSDRDNNHNHNHNHQGILFCISQLDSRNIRRMTWHYVTIVVPLTALYIICVGAKRFSKSIIGQLTNVNCNCRFDAVLFICHYGNFIWLLLFRPLLTLSALIKEELRFRTILDQDQYQYQDQSLSPGWTIAEHIQQTIEPRLISLELGSHLVLLFISILLPFSANFGLFIRTIPSYSLPATSTGVVHLKSKFNCDI